MKITSTFSKMALRVITVILAGLLTTQFLSAQDWYDNDWQYRCPVTVQGLTTAQTDFQVRIVLNSGNFDFTRAEGDGSDIRVTASDGTTLLPFWIENWATSPTRSDTLWVKVPTLPTDGLTVYIYYGNAAPTVPPQVAVETPPSGPFTKNPNKIYPIGTPPGMTYLVAENIVKDDAPGGHYWLAFTESTNFDHYNVNLAWSDDPTNPDAWNWYYSNPLDINVPVITNASSPHLMEHEGTWYIFYGDHSNLDIAVATATSPGGPYTFQKRVLEKGAAGTWEDYRILEPCVFWNPAMNKWIMMYMGDAGPAGTAVEQIGYATADDILAGTGLYQKYASNPCIRFGAEGTYDGGTVADPWVYYFDGVYYIGYAAGTLMTVNNPRVAYGTPPWQTALATTTDFTTFTKQGILLPLRGEYLTLRGDVIRIGDQYVFSYTGGTGPSSPDADLSLATQPVYQTPPSPVNDGNAVFDFFDGFSGTSVDPGKWEFVQGNIGMTSVGSGFLTMTATPTTAVQILGLKYWGTNYVSETRARHPDQGLLSSIMEVGFADKNWNTVRLMDDNSSLTQWQVQAIRAFDSRSGATNFGTSDRNSHVFHVYRQGAGTVGFQIDNLPVQTFSPATVPTMILPPFLMSYATGAVTNSRFIVDWTRVRKWAGSDPVTVAGIEETLITQWTGTAGSDWTTAENWTSGVPQEWNQIIIPASTTPPIFSGSLTVNPAASLTIKPGGALTVTEVLTTNGRVTIESTVESSGSLIVTGASAGNITYNRLLRENNDFGDKHLFSAPVGGQSIPDFILDHSTKIDAIRIWDEVNAVWSPVAADDFEGGRGYNLHQTDGSDGEFSFTGPVVSTASLQATSPYAMSYESRLLAYPGDPFGSINHELPDMWATPRSWTNWGGGGWNLLGNPFASALKITDTDDDLTNDFLSVNEASLAPSYVAVYIYNGPGSQYLYKAKSAGFIDPTIGETPANAQFDYNDVPAGQGFFVLANYNLAPFSFAQGMQTHSSSVPMTKSAKTEGSWPGLKLKAKCGNAESLTTIIYHETMTAGLDPGYDVGQLSIAPDVDIYTTLLMDGNDISFARQALPISGADTLVIPIGIDTEKGGEVTFSAYSVPIGINKFWLEDRLTGIYTDLTTKSYTVNLPAKTYGTGRFFIIASNNTPTGIKPPKAEDTGVRVWTANEKVIIKGSVSDQAICEVYDLNGKLMIKHFLTDDELNTVDLPADTHGVYLIRIVDGMKVTTRKVAIL